MIRDLLIKDFGWKLFSLLLAAFIWYTVQKLIEEPKVPAFSPENATETLGGVGVSMVSTGANAHSYELNSNTVTVMVSGPKAAMDILEANQIHARVDVSNFDTRSNNPFLPVEVSAPRNITVVNVEPGWVQVVLPPKPRD